MGKIALTAGVVIGVICGLSWVLPRAVHGQAKPGSGFAAVPDEKGGWDLTGPYQVVPNWPKPMSQLPGHEKWGWGAVEGIFAENPNRIFIVQRGELPVLAGLDSDPSVWAEPCVSGRPGSFPQRVARPSRRSTWRLRA